LNVKGYDLFREIVSFTNLLLTKAQITNPRQLWCRQSSLAIEKSYCDKLSWGGLDGVPDFEALPNKSEILQIILNEKLNNYAAEGRKCKD